MSIEVNYLAIFLAAVSSMVVGSVWYLPAGFGKDWMKLTGVKAKQMGGKNPSVAYALTFAASLVTAYILAHIAFLANAYYKDGFLQDSLMVACWLWFGFTGTRLLVHDLFEGRKLKLTLINAGHELLTVLVMAFIIGWLKP